jgi:hypothetical protein
VVTSIDADGVESVYSNEVVAIVPGPPVSEIPPIGLVAELILNGSAQFNGDSLSLTTTTGYHLAGSAWYPAPVNIQAFSTDFSFQLTNPTTTCPGDGFAFVIQNDGWSALGPSGGGLGYGPDKITNPTSDPNTPITKSVAIKFDLYDNAGEGANSTGVYVNGVSPTAPAATSGTACRCKGTTPSGCTSPMTAPF